LLDTRALKAKQTRVTISAWITLSFPCVCFSIRRGSGAKMIYKMIRRKMIVKSNDLLQKDLQKLRACFQ